MAFPQFPSVERLGVEVDRCGGLLTASRGVTVCRCSGTGATPGSRASGLGCSAGEALERVLVAAWETIGRYRGLVIVNQRLDPAVLRARLGPAIAPLRPLIKRGQRAGEFDPELPVQWLLTVMLDLIHAASRQVSTGAMDAHAAQTALLRTAAAALRG